MDLDFFKKTRILDGGMGQELLAKGLISKGTLWSTSALLDENFHQLLVDVHLSFINAGADVIVTNNFSSRKIRLIQNKVEKKFKYVNKKACELAIKARDISKNNTLVAGSLPPQNGTYVVDDRDIKIIKKDFMEQAQIIKPYVDFFYLDVITSAKEIEAACEVIEKLNMPVLVGLHLKKNGKIASGETVSEIVKKYKTNNWIGLIGACVSLEIIERSANEMSNLNIPFGFKANLWNIEEPLPVHKFNRSKFNEVGKNPNDTMGKREEITNEVFYKFAKKIKEKGASILGGCCNINPGHIKSISSLK
tara:strand:- start:2231 stop:3148 length:918 start_codon:yes stop_codon:yes gene_type:complete